MWCEVCSGAGLLAQLSDWLVGWLFSRLTRIANKPIESKRFWVPGGLVEKGVPNKVALWARERNPPTAELTRKTFTHREKKKQRCGATHAFVSAPSWLARGLTSLKAPAQEKVPDATQFTDCALLFFFVFFLYISSSFVLHYPNSVMTTFVKGTQTPICIAVYLAS